MDGDAPDMRITLGEVHRGVQAVGATCKSILDKLDGIEAVQQQQALTLVALAARVTVLERAQDTAESKIRTWGPATLAAGVSMFVSRHFR